MSRFFGLALVSPMLALLFVSSVLAHARYDHSTPSPGQVVNASPARVDIFVAQQMRKTAGANTITVSGPDNASADDGNTVVDDSDRKHFSVGLKPNLTQGRYLVSFKTLSDDDSEEDKGQFAFYVGVQPTNDQKAQDQKLALTAQEEHTSHTGLIISIAIVVAIVLLALGFILTRLRKRGA